MIIGWIGSLLLSFSGMPQAYQCYCQGHARGLSICTLLMWLTGEVCYVIATISEFGIVLWLLTNYILNILFISVILRYWFYQGTSMKLKKLKKILDHNFGSPFLPEGMVSTKWVGSGDERSLSIRIKRRDVTIDKDGNVTGSGTFLV